MKQDCLHWFVRYLLKKICVNLVIQGPLHKARITEYYRIMSDAAKLEFTEDNEITLCSFLTECQEDAMERKLKDKE